MTEAIKTVANEPCHCVRCGDCGGSETCDSCGGSGISETCDRCQLLDEMDHEDL
jgi:hypothetical protein